MDLTTISVVETCVFPTFLYGAENWILNEESIELLENFQAEIGRRVLRLSKKHSRHVKLPESDTSRYKTARSLTNQAIGSCLVRNDAGEESPQKFTDGTLEAGAQGGVGEGGIGVAFNNLFALTKKRKQPQHSLTDHLSTLPSLMEYSYKLSRSVEAIYLEVPLSEDSQ